MSRAFRTEMNRYLLPELHNIILQCIAPAAQKSKLGRYLILTTNIVGDVHSQLQNMLHIIIDEPIFLFTWHFHVDTERTVHLHVESWKCVWAMIQMGALRDLSEWCIKQYGIRKNWDGTGMNGTCFNEWNAFEMQDDTIVHGTIRC
jgi:hypothetical protein